jgi:hypothetical protein
LREDGTSGETSNAGGGAITGTSRAGQAASVEGCSVRRMTARVRAN